MKIFISFGGGAQNYRDAAFEVCEQAYNLGVFDQVIQITDLELFNSKEHYDFICKYGDFMLENHRGFGFWIWKSYLVNWLASKMGDGDILVYADSGCRLTTTDKMNRLFEYMKANDILVAITGHKNSDYTSKIVIDYFSNNEISNLNMIEATTFAITISKKSREMIFSWSELCKNLNLLKDPDRAMEPSQFIDHRHDQSLFSFNLYSRYREYVNDGREILHDAVLPLRLRGKFPNKCLEGFFASGNNIIPLSYYNFKEVNLSSSYGGADFDSLFRIGYKKDFNFHTKSEKNPSITLTFKSLKSISVLVIENRIGFENRLQTLLVEKSYDGSTYIEVVKINYIFGGFYDSNPFVISLPKNDQLHSLRISSVNTEPNYLHLKSIYLYE